MLALAVDLGGSHAACAVVNECAVLAKRVVPAAGEDGLTPMLAPISAALREVMADCRIGPADLEGVAMGFCGLADVHRTRVLSTNKKYDDAPSLDLAGWCRDELGLRLRLENDARMALLGERSAGAARGFDDIVMITLGTGFGGAAMIVGRLLRGRHHQAGCLGGHMSVRYGGRLCTCGNIGCTEAEASGWSLPGVCREWPGFAVSSLASEAVLDFATLFRVADSGDRVAGEIVKHSLTVWSAGTVALIHAFDPEIVVVGGGVMSRGEDVLGAIRCYVHDHAWTPWGRVEVRAAELGVNAGLLGATSLLQEHAA